MSGLPGKSRLCSLNLKPSLWSAFLTVISGRVSRLLKRRMSAALSAGASFDSTLRAYSW